MLAGALVTIDAIACNPSIAKTIVEHGADYLLAVKTNQPSLHAEMERFFADVPANSTDTHRELEKGHGRIEDRTCRVSRHVEWMSGDRRFPGEYRFPQLAVIGMIKTGHRIGRGGA